MEAASCKTAVAVTFITISRLGIEARRIVDLIRTVMNRNNRGNIFRTNLYMSRTSFTIRCSCIGGSPTSAVLVSRRRRKAAEVITIFGKDGTMKWRRDRTCRKNRRLTH